MNLGPRRLRAALLGNGFPGQLRDWLTERVESHPEQTRGLLHDEAMAQQLRVGLRCRWLRIEAVPSVYSPSLRQCVRDCAVLNTDMLIIHLGAYDLGLRGIPASLIAARIIALAKFAYRTCGFKLVILMSAVFEYPSEITDQQMADKVLEFNDVLQDAASGNTRLRYVEMRRFKALRGSQTPRRAMKYLHSNNTLRAKSVLTYGYEVKHTIIRASPHVWKQLK